MSLRTFIDNVIVLALENSLVQRIPYIFTTDMVNKMEDDELRLLAAESPSTQQDRAELQRDHDALKQGLQLLGRYRERSTTGELKAIQHVTSV